MSVTSSVHTRYVSPWFQSQDSMQEPLSDGISFVTVGTLEFLITWMLDHGWHLPTFFNRGPAAWLPEATTGLIPALHTDVRLQQY